MSNRSNRSNTPVVETPVVETPVVVTPVVETPVVVTPVVETPVVETVGSSIPYRVSTRKTIGANSGINPLFLAIYDRFNSKTNQYDCEYTLELDSDGLYVLNEYNLKTQAIKPKFLASFEFSKSQVLVLTSSKLSPERIDSILSKVYNSYRSKSDYTNCDYFFLYLLLVLSTAKNKTDADFVTTYETIDRDMYRTALKHFVATFWRLDDREKAIADRLSAYSL